MAGYAPYPILETVFMELKQTPLHQITETFLSFLCLYTLSVLKNIQRRRAEARVILQQLEKRSDVQASIKGPSNELFDDKYKLYDVDIIWGLMTYSAAEPKVEAKLKDQAMSYLIKIMEANDGIGKIYIAKAVKGIRENLPGCARCMRFLLNSYRLMPGKRELCQTMRTAVGKESGILGFVVADLAKYMQKVGAAVNASTKSVMTTVRIRCEGGVGVCGLREARGLSEEPLRVHRVRDRHEQAGTGTERRTPQHAVGTLCHQGYVRRRVQLPLPALHEIRRRGQTVRDPLR